jgi:hypothetical protein
MRTSSSAGVWLVAVALLAGAAHSSAQVAIRGAGAQMFPAEPSVIDPVHVVFTSCGDVWAHAHADFRRAPGTGGWSVEIGEQIDLPCIFTPGNVYTNAVSIPDAVLADGNLTLEVRRMRADGGVDRDFVDVLRTPHLPASVSGTWTNERMPGQGLWLTVTALPSGHPLDTPIGRQELLVAGLAVSWSTFDEQGQPLWLVGAARMPESPGTPASVQRRVRVPLVEGRDGAFASDARQPLTRAWGEIEIEYLGCGRVRAQWRSLDPQRFPHGSAIFHQLSITPHHGCALSAGNAARLGTLREIPAQVP